MGHISAAQFADPADKSVLEAAANGRASGIVARNVRDFLPATRDFEIAVTTPSVVPLRLPTSVKKAAAELAATDRAIAESIHRDRGS